MLSKPERDLRAQLVHWRQSSILLQAMWLEYMRCWRQPWSLALYDDEAAVRKLYFDYSHRQPNLENPRRFSEKLQWLKLHDHNPLQVICADKHEVRSWVAERGYGSLLNNQLGLFENADDIDFESLPEQFVLKATHSSGWNLICRDKRKLDRWKARLLAGAWLRQNIFWNGREWPYKFMPRRITCEKYLEDDTGGLRDYKFYCFNGAPRFVQANTGRGQRNAVQNFYDLDWNLLPFGKDLPHSPDTTIMPPQSLELMLTVSRALARDFCYVRIDFYEIDGQPIFGEMTFYPASGLPDFIPDSYDLWCGDFLTLPQSTELLTYSHQQTNPHWSSWNAGE